MGFDFEPAEDITTHLNVIIDRLELPEIFKTNIVCMRSSGSKARAYARIWSFPRIWQAALDIEPHYIIEVLTQHFDPLDYNAQTKVLIHELLHIPNTFSGAVRPHKFFNNRIDKKAVDKIYDVFVNSEKSISDS
ncbi:MAG: metallopeptidase [Candidatus Diapherotrites archaeon]|nr:metallopeptidase [Candidatus Diapherotrites archaeon]